MGRAAAVLLSDPVSGAGPLCVCGCMYGPWYVIRNNGEAECALVFVTRGLKLPATNVAALLAQGRHT